MTLDEWVKLDRRVAYRKHGLITECEPWVIDEAKKWIAGGRSWGSFPGHFHIMVHRWNEWARTIPDLIALKEIYMSRNHSKKKLERPKVNEKAMLFSVPYAKALLEGRKTQTRRVMLDQNSTKCPFGEVGENIWVREKFYEGGVWRNVRFERPCDWLANGSVWYATEGPPPKDGQLWRCKPSMHMPREYCRTVLQITGIRNEEIQSISEQDAKAEGVIPSVKHLGIPGHEFKSAFKESWVELYGEGSWKTNNKVWVIEFKRLT